MEFDKHCNRYRHIDALQYHPTFCQYPFRAWRDPEWWWGGGGGQMENHKALGFLFNTGPDPLENHKATNAAFNVGPPLACQRNTI